MDSTLQISFDAADPHALARFWAAALHYDVEDHTGVVRSLLDAQRLPPDEAVEIDGRLTFRDVATCRDPQGRRPRLFFQRVPEPKAAKNRVHLDIQVGEAAQPDEVARLARLGARLLWTTSDRGPVNTTMADPEGNEFCVS
jgi:hypothetical protein